MGAARTHAVPPVRKEGGWHLVMPRGPSPSPRKSLWSQPHLGGAWSPQSLPSAPSSHRTAEEGPPHVTWGPAGLPETHRSPARAPPGSGRLAGSDPPSVGSEGCAFGGGAPTRGGGADGPSNGHLEMRRGKGGFARGPGRFRAGSHPAGSHRVTRREQGFREEGASPKGRTKRAGTSLREVPRGLPGPVSVPTAGGCPAAF